MMFSFFYFLFSLFLLLRLSFRLPFLSSFDLTSSYIDSFSQYSLLYVFFTQHKKRFLSWREGPSLSLSLTHSQAIRINLKLLEGHKWINHLSNTIIWWLDICCLLHRYQLHVSAVMAIFRLID